MLNHNLPIHIYQNFDRGENIRPISLWKQQERLLLGVERLFDTFISQGITRNFYELLSLFCNHIVVVELDAIVPWH